MTINWNTAYCQFSAEKYGIVGYRVCEVNDWLAEHPDYCGYIDGDWLDGAPGSQFDASELFESLLRENAERLEKLDKTLAEIASETNENREAA